MSTLYRIASRRWLLAYLGIAGVLAGEVMLLPHPSKLLFGPTIRGKPWCVWEDNLRQRVDREHDRKSSAYRIQEWVGILPTEMKVSAFGHAELAPLLVKLTHDPDPVIRDEAISHLHGICASYQEVFPLIAPLAKHPYAEVRTSAMFMMMNFRDKSLATLIGALDDTAENVRWQAAYQLGNLGPAAKKAIPSLERRLGDESKDVQKIATRAIRDIDPQRYEQLKRARKID